jgi:hypothetical protein
LAQLDGQETLCYGVAGGQALADNMGVVGGAVAATEIALQDVAEGDNVAEFGVVGLL